QTVDVAADSDYQFGVWGMIWFGGSVSTQLRINDVAVGTFLIDRFNTLDVWAQDLVDWNSGTATTAKLELINLSTGFSGNDFAVDDITFTGPAPTSMTPVPLPAGLPLLLAGLGGLALLRRRQR
ncbi:MAG: VPLPA-CTERM sorting domain-containing protein, partial [Pseudomonadota bacterium]